MKSDSCDCCHARPRNTLLHAGGMLVFVIALYLVLKTFGVFSFASSVEGTVGLGAAFVTGLIAATSSCLAVVGGLLLSVSAKWCESHPQATHAQKLRPLLMFNLGRLAGYFLLGGLVGWLGQSLSLSPASTGYVTLFLAMVMVVLGLNILQVLPKKFCRIPLPARMTKKIHGLAESHNPAAPLTLGALTFFVPCGFTQSMQLLALGSGSFLAGGLIMFVFALGTLPALLGISVVSSYVEGAPARLFFRFAGALVLLLGFLNLRAGLILTGTDPDALLGRFIPVFATEVRSNDPFVTVDNEGRQIMSMYVTDNGYEPANFTIAPGKETWVYAVAPKGVSGCASMLVDTTHNLQTPIRQGGNWLGPIAKLDSGSSFLLTCSMGMFKASVRVM